MFPMTVSAYEAAAPLHSVHPVHCVAGSTGTLAVARHCHPDIILAKTSQSRHGPHNTTHNADICSIELATNLRKVSKFPYWGLILVEGTY